MRAEILTIGDELCRGEIVNTNASYFAAAQLVADRQDLRAHRGATLLRGAHHRT